MLCGVLLDDSVVFVNFIEFDQCSFCEGLKIYALVKFDHRFLTDYSCLVLGSDA